MRQAYVHFSQNFRRRPTDEEFSVLPGLPSYKGRTQGTQWHTRVAGIYCDSAVYRVTPRFFGGLRHNSVRMLHFLSLLVVWGAVCPSIRFGLQGVYISVSMFECDVYLTGKPQRVGLDEVAGGFDLWSGGIRLP
jgi:hypothetical protein